MHAQIRIPDKTTLQKRIPYNISVTTLMTLVDNQKSKEYVHP